MCVYNDIFIYTIHNNIHIYIYIYIYKHTYTQAGASGQHHGRERHRRPGLHGPEGPTINNKLYITHYTRKQ